MATENLVFEEDQEVDDVEASYIHYNIASYPSDLTLSGIKEMWDNGAIIIPSFQRKFVWTKKQASLLIDSFLCGLPVPPVFFYIGSDNKNSVIDGQQRILSIVYFLNGFFGEEDKYSKKQIFRLDLPKGSPYKDKTFNELDSSDQRKLCYSSILRAINIKQLDPDDTGTSSFRIFERLNTGGTPLQSQEIRNCVYRGIFADILQELNNDNNWRIIIGKKEEDKHQKDIELILRVFAFTYEYSNYEKPMKEFLNNVMRKHQHGTLETENFKFLFKKTTEIIVSILGEKPFHLRGPLNASALDSIISLIIININNIPNDLFKRFCLLKSNKDFNNLTSTATTDSITIENRRKIIYNILF